MSEIVVVAFEGAREAAEALGHVREDIERAAYRALNLAGTKVRTRLAKMTREQVAFPASYLAPSGGRLTLTEKARSGNLAITITGRDVPTSLARFAGRQTRANRDGKIRVEVAPGAAKFLKRAFFMDLKNGNRGLAVRTGGGAPERAYRPKPLGNGLWLLYGPSVDQVLRGVTSARGGTFGEVEPEALEILEAEFWRLLDSEIR